MDKSKEFDKTHKVKVVKDSNLSKGTKPRYVVIDEETGELLDDAQGYGYKEVKGAYAAWYYKTRDKSLDKKREDKIKHIQQWLKNHKDFTNILDIVSFDIVTHSCDPNEKFDANLIRKILKEENLEIDFKPGELLKVYLNGKW